MLERDMRELITILKPQKVLTKMFGLIGGYAYVKVNLGTEVNSLIEKILLADVLSIARRIYKNPHKAARAAVSMDDTLIALALLKRENEVKLFIRYCINGTIEQYMQRLNVIKIGDMWHPNSGKFGNYLSTTTWILALSSIALIPFYIPYGVKAITAAFTILYSVGVAILRCSFISYNGIMGDTKFSYYFGIMIGLATDISLGIIHLLLPFIAIMLVGTAASLPKFLFGIYLVYSIALTILNIIWNVFSTGYINYLKLAQEWNNFLKEDIKQ